jgi:uncharacterized repeat protein (TIGR02543 family)
LYVKNEIVPAAHNEITQMKLTITNTGNVAFANIRLYDILPFNGDNLGSSGAVGFDSVNGAIGATIKYSTDPFASLVKYGAHGSDNPNLQTATFANSWTTTNPGASATAAWIDLGATILAPGESKEIVLNFQVPSSGNQTAINQFRYSATGGDGSVLNQNTLAQGFSTETIALIYHDNLPAAAVDAAVGVPDAQTDSYIAGISDSLVVSGVTPTLTHYTFADWNSVADGSGNHYSTAQIVNFAAPASIQLYAQWTPDDYTVSFDSNEGSAVSDETVEYNNTATDPNAPTRSHFAFGGWFVDEGLTLPYDFDAPVTADLVLYAKWTEDDRCEWNAEIYYDDESCVKPLPPTPPETPDVTPPIVPGAPNTGVMMIRKHFGH